jgi:hypothetical protein
LINKEVSIIGAKLYLKYLGLNTDLQENIIKDALQKEEFVVPSGWYGCCDVSLFVEAPMHFLMVGVMKSVMLKIGKW